MFYTIYKITNKINQKFYIGMHQTNNIEDNYMGSGLLIKRAINKYGEDNFDKEYLYIFDNFDDMVEKEIELITNDLIESNQCYNLSLGGKGWSTNWNSVHSREKMLAGCKKGGKNNIINLQKYNDKILSDPILSAERSVKISKGNINRIFIHHDILKICKSVKPDFLQSFLDDGWTIGKKYINTGTKDFIWIKKEDKEKMIKSIDLEQYILLGWSKGKNTINTNFTCPKIKQKIKESRKKIYWNRYCKKTDTNFKRPEDNEVIVLKNIKTKETIFKKFSLSKINVMFKKGWVFTGEIIKDD